MKILIGQSLATRCSGAVPCTSDSVNLPFVLTCALVFVRDFDPSPHVHVQRRQIAISNEQKTGLSSTPVGSKFKRLTADCIRQQVPQSTAVILIFPSSAKIFIYLFYCCLCVSYLANGYGVCFQLLQSYIYFH